MKCNVGKTDKVLRLLLGIAIGALGIYFKNWLGLLGIVPIVTALFNFCPLYTLVGLSTCSKK